MRELGISWLLVVILSFTTDAQMPELEWSGHISGRNIVRANDLKALDNGIAIVGEFRDTADVDPGIGVVQFVTPPVFGQMPFVLRLDSQMNVLWAVHLDAFVSANGSQPRICGGPDGTTYFTCGLGADADIDPGPNEVFVNSSNDAVILKIDPDGNILWAKVLGDGEVLTTRTNDIVLDYEGNVITTGYFSGITDFDPGPDSLMLDSDNGRAFIHKMDNDGNLLWVGQFAGDGLFNEGQTVETDAEGNIYVAGVYTMTSDFDIGPDTVWVEDNSGLDAYVMKYSPEGELIWVNSFAGPGEEWPLGLYVSNAGNLVCTGRFEDTLDFDPGPGIHEVVSAGNRDAFVLKLDADGELDWVNTYGSTDFDVGSNVIQGKFGQIHVVGGFTDTVAFNGLETEYTFTTAELGDAEGFILTLDSLGNFIWAGQMGVNPIAIDQDTTGGLYCAGSFLGTVDLDPSPYSEANYTSTLLNDSTHSFDGFVLKLNMDSLLTNSVEQTAEIAFEVSAYPNPSTGTFKVSVLKSFSSITATVSDMAGRVVQTQTFNSSSFSLDFEGESGIYLLELDAEDERAVLRLVKE